MWFLLWVVRSLMENLQLLMVLLAGLFSGFFAAIFAEPVRQRLFRPKLDLEYDKAKGCLSKTREQAITGGTIAEAYYIRVRVTNMSKVIAKDCRAYLVEIEKQDENAKFVPTVYCDAIQLAWSCQGAEDRYRAIDICKGVNQYIDVIVTRSNSPEFDPQIRVKPFRYSDLFKEIGSFRFTIQASADGADPVIFKLNFDWEGCWDTFGVYEGCAEGSVCL